MWMSIFIVIFSNNWKHNSILYVSRLQQKVHLLISSFNISTFSFRNWYIEGFGEGFKESIGEKNNKISILEKLLEML